MLGMRQSALRLLSFQFHIHSQFNSVLLNINFKISFNLQILIMNSKGKVNSCIYESLFIVYYKGCSLSKIKKFCLYVSLI